MSWIPAFEIGVWYAWLFMIVYPLQWMLVLILPRHVVDRTSHAPGVVLTTQDPQVDRLIASRPCIISS